MAAKPVKACIVDDHAGNASSLLSLFSFSMYIQDRCLVKIVETKFDQTPNSAIKIQIDRTLQDFGPSFADQKIKTSLFLTPALQHCNTLGLFIHNFPLFTVAPSVHNRPDFILTIWQASPKPSVPNLLSQFEVSIVYAYEPILIRFYLSIAIPWLVQPERPPQRRTRVPSLPSLSNYRVHHLLLLLPTHQDVEPQRSRKKRKVHPQ